MFGLRAPVSIAVVQLDEVPVPVRGLLEERAYAVIEDRSLQAMLERAWAAGPAALVITRRRFSRGLLEEVALARARMPEVAVVAVCDRFGATEARLMLAAGVSGLVIGRDAASALGPTIDAVRVGQVCVPRHQARYVERPGLSTREKQVIGLVALGFGNREIAERLFVAESTVKSHLSSAFGKLGVRSRNEAVELIVDPAFGLTHGILSLGAEPIPARAADGPRE